MKKIIITIFIGIMVLYPTISTSTNIFDGTNNTVLEKYSYWYVTYTYANKKLNKSFMGFKVIKLTGNDFKLIETYNQLIPNYNPNEYYILISFFQKVSDDIYDEFILNSEK